MGDFLFNLFIGVVVVLCAGFALWLLYEITRWLYRMIFFDFFHSDVKTMKGVVTDMKYTPRRTTHTGKTVITHPEKNEVFIEAEDGIWTFNNDYLYQRVRVDEKVIMYYQERHMKPRFWHGEMEYDGKRMLSITNVKDKTIILNKPKPVTLSKWRVR